MRVAFCGSPEIALPSLRAIHRARPHELVGVVSAPDKPRGRGQRAGPTPVAAYALEAALPLLRPSGAREAGLAPALRAWRPEALVVVSFGTILPREVLDIPARGAWNAHFSLLPRWRGAAPVARAILAGDAETGVSIMRIVERLDEGPVLLRRATGIGPEETAGDLEARLAALAAECLLEALGSIEEGGAVEAPQDGALAVYASKLSKAEGALDWSRLAGEIVRRVRALAPRPGAFTTLPRPGERTLRLRLARARDASGEAAAPPPARAPGTVLAPEAPPGPRGARGGRTLAGAPGVARLLVACGPDGREAVEILALQADGKRELPAGAFLQGTPVEPGTRLGA